MMTGNNPVYQRMILMKTYLTKEELQKIENEAGNLRDRLLIRLLCHLGCRISEALAIETGHIDFQNHTVTIQHLKTSIHIACPDCNGRLSRNSIYCPSCGNKVKEIVEKAIENRKMRTLPMDSETIKLLQDFVKRNGPTVKGNKELIFNINRHRAWQIVKNCAESAGIVKLTNPETGKVHNVSPHRLRDAFAVHAMKSDNSGDGMRLLQEHLGHASFDTTAKYRKISGQEQRNWYNKLWSEKDN
jgi:integrase/recombinase XerD